MSEECRDKREREGGRREGLCVCVCVCVCVCARVPIMFYVFNGFLTIFLSVYLSVCLSVSVSVSLSPGLFITEMNSSCAS